MALDTSYVETPKDDASYGVLEEIRVKAAASVKTAVEVAGDAMVQVAKTAAVAEEGQRAESGAAVENKGTAEGEVAMGIAESTIAGAAANVISTSIQTMLEGSTNPRNSVNTKSIEQQTGGMIGRNATSFEDSFSKIKANPLGNLDEMTRKISTSKIVDGLFEKANIAASSLKDQGDCVSSWKQIQESSQVMQKTRELALANRMAHEAVNARAVTLQARAAPQQPGPAGLTHDAMRSGPKFRAPKDEVTDDSESWVGA